MSHDRPAESGQPIDLFVSVRDAALDVANPKVRLEDSIRRVLSLIAVQLDMDVAFVAEFSGDDEVLRWLEGDAAAFGLTQDAVVPRSKGYCRRMVEGTIPSVVADARRDEGIAALHLFGSAEPGAYIGVPIRFSDGHIYGTLCALSRSAKHSLDERDGRFLEVLSRLIAAPLEMRHIEERQRAEIRRRIERVLEGTGLTVVLQPIVELPTGRVVGFEALSRFSEGPDQGPDAWFDQAAAVGLRHELELAAIRVAVSRAESLPRGAYLSLNVSPDVAMLPEFEATLGSVPPELIVVEITEHARVQDYDALNEALNPLRRRGVQLGIDDAGAGFASMMHIVNLKPNHLKLDLTIIRGIHGDPLRRALAASLVAFATEIDAKVVAEGIEARDELRAVRHLGIGFGQGYYLARPSPSPIRGPLALEAAERSPYAGLGASRPSGMA